uniref:Uncharacterized protein n=1 Tax=Vespula pensylvanica TaxID=30213 RepID=A0A834NL67_VESPE|nr:hypothetical protein H0235_013016 [Vespula pensylvanica]
MRNIRLGKLEVGSQIILKRSTSRSVKISYLCQTNGIERKTYRDVEIRRRMFTVLSEDYEWSFSAGNSMSDCPSTRRIAKPTMAETMPRPISSTIRARRCPDFLREIPRENRDPTKRKTS